MLRGPEVAWHRQVAHQPERWPCKLLCHLLLHLCHLLARVPAKPNPSRIAATTTAAILCLAEAWAQGAASATDGASLGLWTAAAIAPAGHLIEDSSAMGISAGETVCRVSLMQQCRP